MAKKKIKKQKTVKQIKPTKKTAFKKMKTKKITKKPIKIKKAVPARIEIKEKQLLLPPAKPLFEPRARAIREDEKTFALMWSVIFSTVLTGVFAFFLSVSKLFKENYYSLVIIFWILLTILIYFGKRRGLR